MQNISLTSAKQPRFVTLLWLVLVFCFFHFSCSDSGTDPKPKPPGYQEDIPWPSLADSPWPMYRADPQNTGRTEYPGPLKGHIKWTIDSVFIATSGVAVGPDSTIYFVSTKGVDSSLTGLIALNPNGEVKWVFPIEPFASKQLVSPVVAKDGTIYFSSTFGDNKFYAINPNGTIKWQIDDVEVDQIGININKDGTLYFMTNTNTIFCVNKNGTILWSVKNDNLSGSQNGMGISPDGKTLYIQGIPFQNAIHAFDLESKSIKWSFGKDRSNTQPVIDSNGNIYVITNNDTASGSLLYKIDSENKKLWSFNLNNNIEPIGFQAIALDKQGNIYTGYSTLYSISHNGQLNWKYNFQDGQFLTSPMAIDYTGTVYTTLKTSNTNFEIYAFSNKGEILWQTSFPYQAKSGNSLAIGFNSTLYLPTFFSFYLSVIE